MNTLQYADLSYVKRITRIRKVYFKNKNNCIIDKTVNNKELQSLANTKCYAVQKTKHNAYKITLWN